MFEVRNIVLDFGHGGLDENGKYVTAPNKMYVFPDGKKVYEGVLNRQIGGIVGALLETHPQLNVVYTVGEEDPTDLPLGDRVSVVNKYPTNNSLMLSFHCNAGGGTGMEIFTSKGQTRSDILAEYLFDSVSHIYEGVGLRLRTDFSDGDRDKEEDFYVLKKAKGTSVLLELGFFDNIKDVALLEDPKFQSDLAWGIYDGILNFIYQ